MKTEVVTVSGGFAEIVRKYDQAQLELLHNTTKEKLLNDNYWNILRPRMSQGELDAALAQIAEIVEITGKEIDRRKGIV